MHARARERGVNPIVYWLTRAVIQPFFHLYFRLSRIGREHIPTTGPVIFASNHRSFLDPFVLGLITRRPVYYVAKQEIFKYRLVAWFLSSLGAFPVRRGAADADMLETARAILERGECVLMFPEGTRTRPGSLGRPKRGVGRLALETGAPIVPVAIIGTESVRKGWRIRPHKVRIRIGRPLRFPKVDQPSQQLAAAVTDRVWPNVMLQWEWLGGLPPLRRAAVIGAGSWGTSLAVMLARSGVEVDLGTRTREQAEQIAASRVNERHLPGVALPAAVHPMRAADLDLSRHDVVCFAVPAGALPAAVAAHAGAIPDRAGVLVTSKGLVPPLGALPAAFVSERVASWAVAVLGGPVDPAAALRDGASLVLATGDAAFARQVGDALAASGFDVAATTDLVGVAAGRRRHRRRRARRLGGGGRRAQRGRGRGRQGVRRGRRLRAPLRLPARDVRRPRGRRRPRDHRPDRRLPRPPRGRAARAGSRRRRGRRRARRDGRRLGAAARRPRARRRPRGPRPGLAGRPDRRPRGPGALHVVGHRAEQEGQGRRPPGGLRYCPCTMAAGSDSASEREAKARLDAAFTELYRAHLRDVYSYSYYRVGNHHDAEDLTEQTFLQAYRHFERAQRESDGRPLRPWLIRIAHNLAANYYRDRSRRPQTSIDDAGTLPELHTTEALVEDREDLKRILEGVQRLPDDRREALIMRFALGMDNREIARALGRTDGATKVLIHRAIRQLEELVKTEAGSEAI